MITELNERAQAVLKSIIDAYMATGEPVGSRTLSRQLGLSLSPATIRNVMADLEMEGLLFAPHTSAGRLPTQQGLRLYIDGLMEIGDLSADERHAIESQCQTSGLSMPQMLERASGLLSGLSAAASIVVAPKTDKAIKHIQFVRLDEGRVLIVMVMQDGMVENRFMEVRGDATPSSLAQAANYLNARLTGRTLSEAQHNISREIDENRTQLDTITTELVRRGLALTPVNGFDGHIIIRGQSKLLEDVKALEDLERARQLLAALEEQQTIARLLEATQNAEGIQIYIGTENTMFSHTGWSMVLSPYRTGQNKIIGAIGVIGPTRINYSRVIPIVDYTSRVMGKILGG